MAAAVDRSSVIVLSATPSPDIADAVAKAVRICFGALSIAQGAALRFAGDPSPAPRAQQPSMAAADAADLLLGSAWGLARLSGHLAMSGKRVGIPLGRLVARPPLVPHRLQPGESAQRVVEGWRRDRPAAVSSFRSWSATALPGAVDAVIRQLDMRQLVGAVLDRLDLDALVTDVLTRLDVSRASELIVARLELDRLVGAVLRSVDLTSAVAGVLHDLDLDRVVSEALAELDLDTAVHRALQDVDVNQVAAQVLDRLDTEVLVRRVVSTLDLDALISTVVARLDLATVVASALDQLDLTQIVVDQVDLIGVAEYVVNGIDLPGIIRDSTGSVASEAVRVMRLQGAEGDAAVARAVDRMLHRRRHRQPDTIPQPEATSTSTSESSGAGAHP